MGTKTTENKVSTAARIKRYIIEPKASIGNLVLGLAALLLAYEYFTSRYYFKVPDYRLSYIVAIAITIYFVAIRFARYRRSWSSLTSVILTSLDILAAVGVVGLVLQLGVYPMSWILNEDVSVIAFYPSNLLIPPYVITITFGLFVAPRVMVQYALPVILALPPYEGTRQATKVAQAELAPPESVGPEELLADLQRRARQLSARRDEVLRGEFVEADRLLILSEVVDELKRLQQALEAELETRGITYARPPSVVSVLTRRGKNEGPSISVLSPPPIPETGRGQRLPQSVIDNPWADVLSKRGKAKEETSS